MSKKETVLITTAIDYVNSSPHVGHAVEKIQADVLARYYRTKADKDVFFLSGVDENSLKNVLAAKKAGMDTAAFVDQNSKEFAALKELLNLSYDEFIRTTSKNHFEGSQKLWKSLKSGDLYKKDYTGYYCVGCEEFKTEADLCDGKCPEHNTVPEMVKEENYFFKLSAYQDQLLKLIESDTLKIVPEFRKNEVVSFIKSGLEDFSVSRSVARAQNWGVPVPADESQIMYVWVDALANYITGLGYASNHDVYEKYWNSGDEITHIIGKGILRFHAIYWPALLLSAGLRLPTTIYAHEYITIDGKKMSKSLGNVIYPKEIVEKYGVDGARYLLLTGLPFNSDGDITWDKMDAKYTADLSNGIGNLVQRTISMVSKYGLVDDLKNTDDLVPYTEINKLTEEFKFELGLTEVIKKVREQNVYIDENRPWELAKSDNAKLKQVLGSVIGAINHIASTLEPYMPGCAQRIKSQLINMQPEPLFPRIDNNK